MSYNLFIRYFSMYYLLAENVKTLEIIQLLFRFTCCTQQIKAVRIESAPCRCRRVQTDRICTSNTIESSHRRSTCSVFTGQRVGQIWLFDHTLSIALTTPVLYRLTGLRSNLFLLKTNTLNIFLSLCCVCSIQ